MLKSRGPSFHSQVHRGGRDRGRAALQPPAFPGHPGTAGEDARLPAPATVLSWHMLRSSDIWHETTPEPSARCLGREQGPALATVGAVAGNKWLLLNVSPVPLLKVILHIEGSIPRLPCTQRLALPGALDSRAGVPVPINASSPQLPISEVLRSRSIPPPTGLRAALSHLPLAPCRPGWDLEAAWPCPTPGVPMNPTHLAGV